jgi:hypothetical protein
MTDRNEIPIQQGKPLSDADKRLKALFDEMDKQQFEFFDQAGKRIIELSTGLLGVLYAVIAFGDKFPPPYLQGNAVVQWLTLGILVVLVGALLCAVLTIQPRKYKFYESNLTGMRAEWQKLFTHKSTWFRWAHWLFYAGMVLLAVLIGMLILSA